MSYSTFKLFFPLLLWALLKDKISSVPSLPSKFPLIWAVVSKVNLSFPAPRLIAPFIIELLFKVIWLLFLSPFITSISPFVPPPLKVTFEPIKLLLFSKYKDVLYPLTTELLNVKSWSTTNAPLDTPAPLITTFSFLANLLAKVEESFSEISPFITFSLSSPLIIFLTLWSLFNKTKIPLFIPEICFLLSVTFSRSRVNMFSPANIP